MFDQYQDTVISKLIEIFEAESAAEMQGRYYIGDPIRVPDSVLPATFISRDRTTITQHTNLDDEHEMQLVVNAVYNMTSDLGESKPIVNSVGRLYKLMEGRDHSGRLLEHTFAHIVRKYQVLNDDDRMYIALGSNVEIDYVFGNQARGDGILTAEAVMNITVKKLHERVNK